MCGTLGEGKVQESKGVVLFGEGFINSFLDWLTIYN